ncbi:uncharacterized protein ARMOST_18095 [Armillaria ostoyae]|uniref:Uncharacterized protein n=1 Tax=Armillaria ostoyae TaxID=47428 RepID=A0A284S0T5_ARMOS|nr:uncharacterized protein ARMOST_18095 [Armillaria ostoyae]
MGSGRALATRTKFTNTSVLLTCSRAYARENVGVGDDVDEEEEQQTLTYVHYQVILRPHSEREKKNVGTETDN